MVNGQQHLQKQMYMHDIAARTGNWHSWIKSANVNKKIKYHMLNLNNFRI